MHLTLNLVQPCVQFNNKLRLQLRFYKNPINNLEVVQPHCKKIPYFMVFQGEGTVGLYTSFLSMLY